MYMILIVDYPINYPSCIYYNYLIISILFIIITYIATILAPIALRKKHADHFILSMQEKNCEGLFLSRCF